MHLQFKYFIIFILLIVTLPLQSQLSKSFDNREEWMLSYELYFNFENELEGASLFDSILLLTKEPDKLILQLGIDCYLKTNQKAKASKILLEFVSSEYISVCDDIEYAKLLDKQCEIKDSIQRPALKEELINMWILDQYYRGIDVINYLGSKGYEVHHDSLLNYDMRELDILNQVKLKKILSKYGFPDVEMVGQLGVAHMNYQPMKKPEEVNLRRMKMGMMPFEMYLNSF